jgi:uncharacterized membrane protein/DNA-binding XRE family transcriptional regulator
MRPPNRRLREARERRGWSQARVAEQIGTEPGNVSRWERGYSTPSPHFRELLSSLFGVGVSDLGLLDEAPVAPAPEAIGRSSRWLVVLGYSLFWPTGLLVLLFFAKDRFVRFHALQSVLLFAGVTVCNVAFVGLTSLDAVPRGAPRPGSIGQPLDAVFLLAVPCVLVLNVAAVISWIVGMVMGWKGRYHKLPLVGDRAERLAGPPDAGAARHQAE